MGCNNSTQTEGVVGHTYHHDETPSHSVTINDHHDDHHQFDEYDDLSSAAESAEVVDFSSTTPGSSSQTHLPPLMSMRSSKSLKSAAASFSNPLEIPVGKAYGGGAGSDARSLTPRSQQSSFGDKIIVTTTTLPGAIESTCDEPHFSTEPMVLMILQEISQLPNHSPRSVPSLTIPRSLLPQDYAESQAANINEVMMMKLMKHQAEEDQDYQDEDEDGSIFSDDEDDELEAQEQVHRECLQQAMLLATPGGEQGMDAIEPDTPCWWAALFAEDHQRYNKLHNNQHQPSSSCDQDLLEDDVQFQPSAELCSYIQLWMSGAEQQ